MIAWISANLINIVLVAGLILLMAVLIRSLVRNRKAGGCSGGCGSCGSCGGSCSGCSSCTTSRPSKSKG